MRSLLLAATLIALAACRQEAAQQPAAQNEAATASEPGGIKGVDRSYKGKPAPETVFSDPDGEEATLADFTGKPVLVNLWATWCAPCVKELPTLDTLSRRGVQVLAINQDSGPHPSVVAFLKAHRITTLESYQDSKMGLSGVLGPETVLPTSILYDARGKEVWRYVGDLDWMSPEAAKLLAEGGVAPKAG